MKQEIKKILDELAEKCISNRLSLVTAESCTGGGLSYFITQTPGLSSLLERGYVTYSNNSKEEVLDVDGFSIQTHGAVSEIVAKEMAEGALKNSKAQISVATSGIDGDENHNEYGKGIVWIACAGLNKETIAIKKQLSGHRKDFNEHVIAEALQLVKMYIS